MQRSEILGAVSGIAQDQGPYRIAIINPNSNQSMTQGLIPAVEHLGYENTEYKFITADPSAPYSINNLQDAVASVEPAIRAIVRYSHSRAAPPPPIDAFLVACFSPHPLVKALPQTLKTRIAPLGIMEAAFQAAANLCESVTVQSNGDDDDGGGDGGSDDRTVLRNQFAVITTGQAWIPIFDDVIKDLGGNVAATYRGTLAIGVHAGDLHPSDPLSPLSESDSVRNKVRVATREALNGGRADVIVLGCAGMAGMETWVRDEARKEGRPDVKVVDGVKVGVGILQAYLRAGV